MNLRKTRRKFDKLSMDNTWKQIGRISKEPLTTFLALSKSNLVLYDSVKQMSTKYSFKENSQISIRKKSILFRIDDLELVQVNSQTN